MTLVETDLVDIDTQLAVLKRERQEIIERRRDFKEGEVLSMRLEEYVKEAWPVVERGRLLKWNWHIGYICEYLEAVTAGEFARMGKRGVVFNIPPRCMKSLNVGVFWPTWTWTGDPGHQFLTLSNAGNLAIRDAVKSRRLIQSKWYQQRWGTKFQLAADQNAKSRYENDHGGHRIAFGLEASFIGEGGDTIIIDDPHDIDGSQSEVERQGALNKFDQEVIGRLNDQVTGQIVIIMQRLHEKDLSGHVLAEEGEFEHLCLPMEYEGQRYVSSIGLDDPRKKKGQLLWDERFPKKSVKSWARRLGPYGTSGQLQQRPTPGEGGILKRFWWKPWPLNLPLPTCEYILQVYDTAYGEKEENDFSACTTWGVFRYDHVSRMVGEGLFNIILLGRWKDQVGFPGLKTQARKLYEQWNPDIVLVEPKASGKSLVQEMARTGISMFEWTPGRSGARGGRELDKVARAHVASAVLSGGAVWYPTVGPSGAELKWPQEVIDECAAFPKAEYDDITDTCTIAWSWLRQRWYAELEEDPDEDDPDEPEREPAYG